MRYSGGSGGAMGYPCVTGGTREGGGLSSPYFTI